MKKILTRVCTQVIEDIHDSRFFELESTFNVIERLLSKTRVPDAYFKGVAETGLDFIIQEFQTINESRFYNAKKNIKFIQLLLVHTRS
jgi:hypothetical protein